MDDIPDITELSKLYLVKAKNSKEDLYYLKVIYRPELKRK